MKKIKTISLFITAIIIVACHSVKKSTTTTSTSAALPAKPADGIYAPGNEELAAIQARYKDVTLDILKEGYALYTQGACINCHGAQNIYQYDEGQWKNIIDDMAIKAQISDAQKDAVYKYILAIKVSKK